MDYLIRHMLQSGTPRPSESPVEVFRVGTWLPLAPVTWREDGAVLAHILIPEVSISHKISPPDPTDEGPLMTTLVAMPLVFTT